jgi:hypothetical protein
MILSFGLLLIACFALSRVHAQSQSAPAGAADQSGPVGLVGENQPALGANSELTADYPLNQAGILIQSAQWIVVTNQFPTKTKVGRGWAASVSYGMVPAKILSEYDGEHAPTQIETAQPVLCVCHFMSLPGNPAIVRLHPKKGIRELDGGRMIVYPIVGGSKVADANRSDLIPADVSHPDGNVWLIRPQVPLPPGEYALMLGTQNVSIYPFTVAPPSVHPTGAN